MDLRNGVSWRGSCDDEERRMRGSEDTVGGEGVRKTQRWKRRQTTWCMATLDLMEMRNGVKTARTAGEEVAMMRKGRCGVGNTHRGGGGEEAQEVDTEADHVVDGHVGPAERGNG